MIAPYVIALATLAAIVLLGTAVCKLASANVKAQTAIVAVADEMTRLCNELALHKGRLSVHAAQLKGAGERIRTIEAKQASDSMTLDAILERLTTVEGRPRPEFNSLKEAISRLRAEILGGTMPPNNMSVIGAVSELRAQVEGINSRLGNKVDRLVNLDKTVVSTSAIALVAQDAARREVKELKEIAEAAKRAHSWLKRARKALLRAP